MHANVFIMQLLQRSASTDIPFNRDDAHRLLPAMIACLVGFAALLLITAVSLHGSLRAQTRDVAGVLQVEVPSDANAATIDKTLGLLHHTDGVEDVTPLDRDAMEKLLKPWLGADFSIDRLPVPTLLEVSTKVSNHASAVDVPNLRKALTAIDPDIHVVDQGPWIAQLATALGTIQTLVLSAAGLLIACVVGMVVLVARTNLKLHFKTVGLLHMFGATDDYILRQFQWNGAALAARGAAAGIVVAGLVFAILVTLSAKWQSPVIPIVHFTFLHGVTLLILPVFTGFVALLATRVTVRSMLHHMH